MLHVTFKIILLEVIQDRECYHDYKELSILDVFQDIASHNTVIKFVQIVSMIIRHVIIIL